MIAVRANQYSDIAFQPDDAGCETPASQPNFNKGCDDQIARAGADHSLSSTLGFRDGAETKATECQSVFFAAVQVNECSCVQRLSLSGWGLFGNGNRVGSKRSDGSASAVDQVPRISKECSSRPNQSLGIRQGDDYRGCESIQCR
jgi:hypothetical protein